MGILYVALSAFVGGLFAATLGWLDSGDYFEGRKFASSIIRALVAGIVFSIGYALAGSISVMDIMVAFAGGAGVDALGNRLAGSIRMQ